MHLFGSSYFKPSGSHEGGIQIKHPLSSGASDHEIRFVSISPDTESITKNNNFKTVFDYDNESLRKFLKTNEGYNTEHTFTFQTGQHYWLSPKELELLSKEYKFIRQIKTINHLDENFIKIYL